MTVLSRREFGRALIAAGPVAAVFGSMAFSARTRVTVGVSTSSFRDLPRVTGADNIDDVLQALRAVKATHIELALANLEPAPPSTSPTKGGSPGYPQLIVLTPAQIAAIEADYRRSLRAWRLESGPEVFDAVRAKLVAAGLTVHGCATSFDDSWTDEEIDAAFRQVKALGATTVSSPMTLAIAARLVPFAERHKMNVAIHNEVSGSSSIAMPQMKQALALSRAFSVKFDAGNVTASNADAVAELRGCQSRLASVLMKDRLRNGGASQYFGEGDTPLAAVLDDLQSSLAPVPAIVQYDYVGLHSSVDEVRASLVYVAHTIG
jgi:hypothetical protein